MRNRAFAAEFLAPAEALRASISQKLVDPHELEVLADRFRVSPFVIGHQLRNHRIATVAADLP
jgi:Zn-dependent peptidase ImmA (M78 family)